VCQGCGSYSSHEQRGGKKWESYVRICFFCYVRVTGGCSGAEAFPDRGLIVVRNPKANESEPPKNFTFDAVFAASVEQKQIYDICAASVVESVLGGYNGTIFAYGQVFLVLTFCITF
jgi:hypothetical protein